MDHALSVAEWQFVWNVGQSLLTLGIGVYLYLSQREQVRRETLKALEHDVDSRLDEINGRLTKIEAGLAEQPKWPTCHAQIQRIAAIEESWRAAVKSADVANIHARIDQVDKELAELRGETKGIQHLLQTIDNFLRRTA